MSEVLNPHPLFGNRKHYRKVEFEAIVITKLDEAKRDGVNNTLVSILY